MAGGQNLFKPDLFPAWLALSIDWPRVRWYVHEDDLRWREKPCSVSTGLACLFWLLSASAWSFPPPGPMVTVHLTHELTQIEAVAIVFIHLFACSPHLQNRRGGYDSKCILKLFHPACLQCSWVWHCLYLPARQVDEHNPPSPKGHNRVCVRERATHWVIISLIRLHMHCLKQSAESVPQS